MYFPQMDTQSPQKQLQDLQDSLDSAHHRLDRFYSWASQLQVETRNIQQRLKFIESQSNIFDAGFSPAAGAAQKKTTTDDPDALLARLAVLKSSSS